jgi:hypothetical protein
MTSVLKASEVVHLGREPAVLKTKISRFSIWSRRYLSRKHTWKVPGLRAPQEIEDTEVALKVGTH